jgi:hypothetical protein
MRRTMRLVVIAGTSVAAGVALAACGGGDNAAARHRGGDMINRSPRRGLTSR